MQLESEILSRVTHEILTPLNSITGLSRLIRENPKDEAAVLGYANQISVSAAFLLSLVTNIIDNEQISLDNVVIQHTDFSLRTLVDTLKLIYGNAAEQTGIDFSLVIPEPFPETVTGDSARINRVLGNLLSNAIRFNRTGGRVDFLVEDMGILDESRHTFRFTVSDTGIGIADDKLPGLFKRRISDDDENAVYGAGLGLFVAQSLVGKMGGQIFVRSIEGQGSTFWFELPITVPSEQKLDRAEEKHDALQGKTILVADDNSININIVKHILKSYGCKVEACTNGKDALQLFSASEPGHFTAILLDIRMPVMDGLEAARKIRALGGEGSYSYDALTVPIVAMTANAMDSDRQKSFDAGMNAHLAKPVQPDELYNTLVSLLR